MAYAFGPRGVGTERNRRDRYSLASLLNLVGGAFGTFRAFWTVAVTIRPAAVAGAPAAFGSVTITGAASATRTPFTTSLGTARATRLGPEFVD